jgi:sulfofructose kinase
MNPRLIALGMAAQDTIYRVPAIPSTPVKVLATNFSECGGGMAANAAVAAARLGAAVSLWSRVGDDALGNQIAAELAGEGVDVAAVRRMPGCRSAHAAILVDPQGERLICAYNDPAFDAHPGWLPIARVAEADAVMADVRWPQGAACLLNAARAQGKPAVLDADVGPHADLHALLPCATHVAFSHAGLVAACGDGAIGARLREAATLTPAVVGVTLGAEGFLWLEEGREHRAPGVAIRAADTLAAGDVWHAAFTVAIAGRSAIAEAARFANVAAAIKCERMGGRRGAPTRAEVDLRLKQL